MLPKAPIANRVPKAPSLQCRKVQIFSFFFLALPIPYCIIGVQHERVFMIKCAGYDVVGGSVTCTYNGKSYAGKVLSQRKTDKGNLLVVETADGVKSIYWEKTVDCVFRVKVPPVRNSDDGYDAVRDRRLERYGIR